MSGKPWFKPKAYGYGAGMPTCWQGWALIAGYCAVTLAGALSAAFYVPLLYRVPAVAAAVAIPLAILMPIARAKTEGGWRWRDGRN